MGKTINERCYVGENNHDVYRVLRNWRQPLPPRNDLCDHSPTGFAWGYGGSGPAQLALAILADVYDDEFALANYQQFKWDVVAKFGG